MVKKLMVTWRIRRHLDHILDSTLCAIIAIIVIIIVANFIVLAILEIVVYGA